ncbi:MAG TPA: aldolase/citrate lyase family protein [Chloroflexota bacterium]|nr:aldolase/citrate lyase family protein [Chloroflexota bacterium]
MRISNPVATRLREGKISIGSWLNLGSPLAAEVLATEGFEWLTVDMEHTAWGISDAAHAFRAIEARGAVPLARSWSHEPEVIARILDAGALGVVVPHVSTAEQARELVQAVRYPPLGKRSSGTGRGRTFVDYFNDANDNILLIPQIEDPEGIENAPEIMAIPGVDVGFLGPNDLGLAMGLKPSEIAAGNPEHERMLVRLLEACQQAGKPAGISVSDVAGAIKWIKQGFRMIDLSNDLTILQTTVRGQLASLRSSL